MWGLRSPTPRGRTESCTLHILRMCLQVLTGSGEFAQCEKCRVTPHPAARLIEVWLRHGARDEWFEGRRKCSKTPVSLQMK